HRSFCLDFGLTPVRSHNNYPLFQKRYCISKIRKQLESFSEIQPPAIVTSYFCEIIMGECECVSMRFLNLPIFYRSMIKRSQNRLRCLLRCSQILRTRPSMNTMPAWRLQQSIPHLPYTCVRLVHSCYWKCRSASMPPCASWRLLPYTGSWTVNMVLNHAWMPARPQGLVTLY